jgi:hypothetical protein
MENSLSINNNKFNIEKKNIVNIGVLIFALITVMIFILIVLYYLTPNNYLIIILDKNKDDKFKLVNEIEYTIEPNSSLIINNDDIDTNKYLKFSEETNLIIKNFFKSQNITINKDTDLIKSKYNSEIFIVNNLDKEKKIKIQFYVLT